MNLICRLFRHNWVTFYYWDDKLKVNVHCPICVRCGVVDHGAILLEVDRYNVTACPKCGAWVCTSGICSYCGCFGEYSPDMR